MSRSARNVLLILLTAALGLLLPTSGPADLRPAAQAAAAFNVNSTGDGADSDLNDGVCNDGSGLCTLRAAVQQANQLAGADTINVTAAGTISLTSQLPSLTSMTITGPGAAQLTVRRDPGATTFFRVFRTNPSATVGMSGLTVTGGRTAEDDGGGIYNSQSAALTLSDVVVTDNACQAFVFASSGRGGGIYNEGSLTLTDCTVRNNSAADSAPGSSMSGRDGGGIYANRGTVNITRSTVSGNKAGSSFTVNTRPGSGGGLYISSNATATLTNSTVSGNSSGASVLSTQGGGIFNSNGDLTLDSCTVANNRAGSGTDGSGGGIFGSIGGLTNLRNTVVANNAAGRDPDLEGYFTSQDFNLIRNPGRATIDGTTTHNVTGADPLLSPLQNNGGPTLTHAPLAGSPAIDAGDGAGLTTDQRGLARPADDASAANASDGSDIGAFEV